MRRALLALAGALLALGPLGISGSAYAEDGVTISHVEPSSSNVRILVSLPEGSAPQLDDVAVTIDGLDAEATAESAGTSTRAVERTTVLAMDTSNSMRGERFAAAQAAARQFLREVPDDVQVGIVTFDSEVTTALEPTTDREAALEVIDGLELARQTLVYDGVIAAVGLTGDEGLRRVLLLSDGGNTNATPLTAVEEAITDAGVQVDAVALEQSAAASRPLERIAAAGGGSLIPADPEALAAAFAAQASSLARQVLVTATLPEGLDSDEANLQVTLPSADGDLVASAFSIVREGGGLGTSLIPTTPDEGIRIPQEAMWGGLAALGLGLAMLLGSIMTTSLGGHGPSSVEDRIAAFGSKKLVADARADGSSPLESAKSAAASMLERNRGLEARIETRLEAAGSALKPAEWFLLHGVIMMAFGLVGLMLGGGSILVMLLALLLGAACPWLWLGQKRRKRIKDFDRSLADTLQLMAGSLQAGMSLAQSIDSVVNEGREPIATEFRRVLVETRLGVPLEVALEGIAQRLNSLDFAWVVMAIRIQREVGGNLAELLTTVAATLREREYLRRQVQTLSAEGKLSAYILIALPIGMFGYLMLVRREYAMAFFTDLRGIIMLLVAAFMLSAGWFMMNKIVKVEV